MAKDQRPRTKARAAAALLFPAEADGKPYDLRERTLQFALDILALCAQLPSTPEALIVRNQLVRAATSVGANVEEEDGTISKADRRKSLVIARKEALESRYWLRIVSKKWPSPDVPLHIQEATELVRILSRLIQLLS